MLFILLLFLQSIIIIGWFIGFFSIEDYNIDFYILEMETEILYNNLFSIAYR